MRDRKKKYRVNAVRLKAARKNAKLTVEKLSELAQRENEESGSKKAGFSVSDIQKYEKGGAYIYAEKLKILASLLNTCPEDIIFFDTPEPLSDTLEFKTWQYFSDYMASCTARLWGVHFYKRYMSFIFNCCNPSWERLSGNNSTTVMKKENNSTETMTAVYAYTRRASLRRIDFENTLEILELLATNIEETKLLVTQDRHIAELFEQAIRKHQALLDELIKSNKAMELDAKHIKGMRVYFDILLCALKKSEWKAAGDKREPFEYDVDSDQAAYHEEIYWQVMLSDLREL